MLLATGLLVLIGALAGGVSAQSTREGGSFQSSMPGVKFEGKRLITAQEIAKAQDVVREKYTLRSKPDTDGKKVVRNGTSIAALAELAHLKQGSFGYLTFPRADGSTLYLSSADIFNYKPRFKDRLPPLVSVKSGSTRLFRNVRQNEPRDVNAGDEIETPPGEPLRATAEKGNVLGVEVKASEDKPEAGDTVDLTASYSGKTLPDEKVRFSWRFSDGGTAEGETVSHTYAKAGEFTATATATGTRDSGGEGSATIEIGKVKPDNEGDGTGDGGQGTGGYGGGTGDYGAGTGAGGYVPPAYNPGSFGPYPGYSNPGGGSPTPPPANPGSKPPAPAPSGQQAPTQSPPLAPGFENISGTLVTDVSSGGPANPGSEGSEPSPTDSQPSEETIVAFDQKDSSSMTLPLTGLGVALLFAAGAGRELLRSRRRAL